jgi:hypothetical protein
MEQAPIAAGPLEASVGRRTLAYAVFADNGNIRIWSQDRDPARKLAESEGLPLVPLCSAALLEETLDLLAVMFDAYEGGADCYEDPEDCAGHLGKAVQLDEATFDRIADLLNEHRPRNPGTTTPNAEVNGVPLAARPSEAV